MPPWRMNARSLQAGADLLSTRRLEARASSPATPIVGTLNWTDSFWALFIPTSPGAQAKRAIPFTDCDERADLDLAYTRAITEHLKPASAEWDFFLDPPTFVGNSDGERACWIYVAWKLVTSGNSADFREWEGRDFAAANARTAAANAQYRRVRRKYNDSPPDKAEELKELMTRK
jgi:hypothetical protein